MEMKMHLTSAEVLALVARLNFHSFDAAEKMAFPGCDSDDPKIAYSGDMAVLVDGNFIELYSPVGKGENIFQFQLVELQFNANTGRDD